MKPEEKRGFIEKIAPWAQAAHARHGVPASITVAQAILESNWGESKLSREAYNYFGIKAARASDPFILLPTAEYLSPGELSALMARRPWVRVLRGNGSRVEIEDRFRTFTSPAECIDWRGKWLSTSKIYARAMEARDDAIVFATRLWECGYATDPEYPKKLVALATQFHLFDLDAAAKAVHGKKEGQR